MKPVPLRKWECPFFHIRAITKVGFGLYFIWAMFCIIHVTARKPFETSPSAVCELPCVNDSGLTFHLPAMRCKRSSPTAAAAVQASFTSPGSSIFADRWSVPDVRKAIVCSPVQPKMFAALDFSLAGRRPHFLLNPDHFWDVMANLMRQHIACANCPEPQTAASFSA